ncbi:hypothetical protein RRG08_027693 [Elysia crispata]|uniref:Uncharacterized protein n=1 Tax=Elysia crispata TaxID=231223 RepID=A0AAE0XN90_9GAST|nr:hypothetical protein RRG08_027693 [Elysia crispata]
MGKSYRIISDSAAAESGQRRPSSEWLVTGKSGCGSTRASRNITDLELQTIPYDTHGVAGSKDVGLKLFHRRRRCKWKPRRKVPCDIRAIT